MTHTVVHVAGWGPIGFLASQGVSLLASGVWGALPLGTRRKAFTTNV